VVVLIYTITTSRDNSVIFITHTLKVIAIIVIENFENL